ncbi:MAG: site-specific integrase [Clostridia bacterium]|nr:site-specific integrase [Clostridia bacterium]
MENIPRCRRCDKPIPIESVFCLYCGKKQVTEQRRRTRGNGQGTVYKLPNGKYRATVTLRMYADENGKVKRKTISRSFDKKKDAVAALPLLSLEPEASKKKRAAITFKELYDNWLPTHNKSKSTMDCYKSAFKYFMPVWHERMEDIDIDDLQDCVDNCGKGKRTQQNMKAVCGLVYKYGIPRSAVPSGLNLAEYLRVSGDGAVERESFTESQIEQIRVILNKIRYADYVYCMIYLGFRPSEFLSLDVSRYNEAKKCFVGGGKTTAGTNRTVTISNKIQPYVTKIVGARTEGTVFCDDRGRQWSLKDFTEKAFYPVLKAAGIDNPIVEVGGGVKRHKYTPHTCRHTFATLMKRVDAPSKDKLALIGHTSEEMLRYYQDVDVSDLEKITNQL